MLSLSAWRAAVKAPKDQGEKQAPLVHPVRRGNQGRLDQLVPEATKVSPVLRDPQVRLVKTRFGLSVSTVAQLHARWHVIRMKCSSPPIVVLAEVP